MEDDDIPDWQIFLRVGIVTLSILVSLIIVIITIM